MEYISNIEANKTSVLNIFNKGTVKMAICMYGDETMQGYAVDGSTDLTGKIVVCNNLNTDNPTWYEIVKNSDVTFTVKTINIDILCGDTIIYGDSVSDFTFNGDVIVVEG